jgi:hypothetical protein
LWIKELVSVGATTAAEVTETAVKEGSTVATEA